MIMMDSLIFGHFTLAGSREQATYSGPSRFDPIQGGTYNRPDGDCMTLKNNAPKIIQAGSSNLFKFEIGNEDALGGLCMAYLKDKNKKTTRLNKIQDCVASNQAMSVDIPNVDCVGCVLQVVVQAQGDQNFDSCVDVTVQKAFVPQSNPVLPIINSPAPADPSPGFASQKTTDLNFVPQKSSSSVSVATPSVIINDGQDHSGDNRTCDRDGLSYNAGGSRVVLPEGKKCVQKKDGITIVDNNRI